MIFISRTRKVKNIKFIKDLFLFLIKLVKLFFIYKQFVQTSASKKYFLNFIVSNTLLLSFTQFFLQFIVFKIFFVQDLYYKTLIVIFFTFCI